VISPCCRGGPLPQAASVSNAIRVSVASADQVKQALGRDLDELAAKIGVGKDEAADALAQKLPDAVDNATPTGSIPSAEEVRKAFAPPG
jgi:uncharacterized protein YidB (DUF937 family)